MDIDFQLIGQRVKLARQSKRLTQDQLAEMLSFVGGDSLAHIECNRNKPSLQTLIRIAMICDVSLDYLAGLTDAPHKSIATEIAEQERLTAPQTELLRKITKDMIPYVKELKN